MTHRTLRSVLLVCALAGSSVSAHDVSVLPHVELRESQQALNGFPVGSYPAPGDRGPAYAKPTHLLEVTREDLNHAVSPHFEVGEFLCKQPGGWPKYLLLEHKLIRRLEQIVGILHAEGLNGDDLVVMSGYRTPRYNRGLGNVPHSRHLYGDAADVYLDSDSDGLMDDLNGDGELDVDDAIWLMRRIEQEAAATQALGLEGGLAAYPPTSAHGAFIHVDTRGQRARWGAGR